MLKREIPAGGAAEPGHEVAICHITDCPLHRFRNTSKSKNKPLKRPYTSTPSNEKEKFLPDYGLGADYVK